MAKSGDDYDSDYASAAWIGWQTGRASQPEPRPPIEYRYTGGTIWCELGPAEKMRSDFDGVYRLMEGEFPVWRGAIAAETLPANAQDAGEGCPHAGPFRYCETCAVSPCPIGLGGKN